MECSGFLDNHTRLRSPSLERANIQSSPSCFPNRESFSITHWMADPTSPDPPVTRITVLLTDAILVLDGIRDRIM